MITAETITDEQLRELRREAETADRIDHETSKWASYGLGLGDVRQEGRARCAEILNARAKADEERRWTEGCSRHGEPFCNCERNARAKESR